MISLGWSGDLRDLAKAVPDVVVQITVKADEWDGQTRFKAEWLEPRRLRAAVERGLHGEAWTAPRPRPVRFAAPRGSRRREAARAHNAASRAPGSERAPAGEGHARAGRRAAQPHQRRAAR